MGIDFCGYRQRPSVTSVINLKPTYSNTPLNNCLYNRAQFKLTSFCLAFIINLPYNSLVFITVLLFIHAQADIGLIYIINIGVIAYEYNHYMAPQTHPN
jgi:hypothetical protein